MAKIKLFNSETFIQVPSMAHLSRSPTCQPKLQGPQEVVHIDLRVKILESMLIKHNQ
jgi:hypothetical protein